MSLQYLIDHLDEIVDKLDNVEEKIDDITGSVMGRYAPKMKKDITKLIKKSVQEFYNEYKPIYYTRKYSLKYMHKITTSDDGIRIDFGGSYTYASHRLDNEELYELVFKQGYHGGSVSQDYLQGHPDGETPYWRTPHPKYTSWGRPALQTESPWTKIQNEFDNYKKDILQQIASDIINETVQWLSSII